jgi:FkbM family methyltransferase
MNVFIDPRFDDVYRHHPIVLADIGARGGLKKNWRVARRHLRVLGFEPDKAEFNRLLEQARNQGTSDTYFGVALHNHRGSVPLHVARDRGLTSMFEPNRSFLDAFPDASRFDTVDHREIEADTLDHLIETEHVDDLDFIKADTQGSELFVLEGAARALESSVVGVEVEVEFAPIYKEQPLFADVDRFLRGLGYLLFDLRPCYWKRERGRAAGGPYGQIIWADALYLKSEPALGRIVRLLATEQRKAKALKAMSVALLYGYSDYALQIAQNTGDLFSPEDREVIDRQLGPGSQRSGMLSGFPGRQRIAGLLCRLCKTWRKPYQGWSVSDPDLGNPD